MLLQGDLISYLLEHGCLNAERVVAGDVTLEDASRRNRNFRVLSKRGPCYFVKQASPGVEASIAREARVLRFLGSPHGPRHVARHVPEVSRYDPKRSVIIFHASPDTETMDEVLSRAGQLPVPVGKALGGILGTLHSATSSGKARAMCERKWPGDPPWVLGIHRPDVPMWWTSSEANLQLLRIIQQFPEFTAGLDHLRASWRRECLIHGDLKSANMITRRGIRGLTIVDWELAGFGDPAWDVGSIWGDALGLWILTIPMSTDATIEEFLKLAPFPLKRLQPALKSFWHRYAEARALGTEASRSLLMRSVELAAARLLQAAFENTVQASRPTVNVAYMLQLSWNMLSRPGGAAANLLGLDP